MQAMIAQLQQAALLEGLHLRCALQIDSILLQLAVCYTARRICDRAQDPSTRTPSMRVGAVLTIGV